VSGGAGAGARATAAYNLARLSSYAVLGAVAGAAGAGFDRAGTIAGIARPAAIIAGSLMILWGLASALAAGGVRVPQLAPPAFARAALDRAMRVARGRSGVERGIVLGVLTPLLPCGWLYAFVATAAAAGSPLRGAAVMGAFWLGTVPAMAAVGLGAQRALGPMRTRLPVITSAALVVIGLLTVAGKFTPGDHAHGGSAHAMEMPASGQQP
jgi:sulfite exporter TauE/SafE